MFISIEYPSTIIIRIIEKDPIAIYELNNNLNVKYHKDVSKKDLNNVMNIAYKAHNLIGCRGVTRSDFKFDKGKFLVIGSLDLTNEKLRYDNNQIAGSNSTIIYPIFVRETSFEINPTLGYFVSDLWAIGLSGGIGFGKGLIKYSPSSVVEESVGKTNTASLGVFMRKYWVWTDKFSLFAASGGVVSAVNTKTPSCNFL